jgi:ferredoxin-type protein NapH
MWGSPASSHRLSKRPDRHPVLEEQMTTRQKIRVGLTLFSFLLFPATFYYLSPALIIGATYHGIVNGSFIIFAFLFISALFVGRCFCGWLCPGGGCQEAIMPVRNRRIKKGNWVKWIIWVPWIGSIALLAIKSGGYKTIDFFYQTKHGLSIGDINALLTYFFVLALIAIPAFTIGTRSFCHHLCWMAPFMIIGKAIRDRFKWKSLILVPDAGKCVACHTCTSHCPMSLEVEEMVKNNDMNDAECILCGSCIDNCKQGAIKYSFD